MWPRSQSKVSTRLKVLIFLEIHLTFARAAFWVGPQSGDCCWTPELKVKSKELSSDLMCAIFCAHNTCDSYYFGNGLCELSHATMDGRKIAVFKPWKKKEEVREVARNKPAQASPMYTQNYVNQAVDGKTATMYHSANETPQPWILVDLKNNFWVSKLRILLFTGSERVHRTADIQILLGTAPPPTELDFSQYTEVGYIEEPLAPDSSWQEFEVSPPMCSRYAVVTKKVEQEFDKNLIQLFELEVIAMF